MIYNKDIKDILILYAIINLCLVTISINYNITSAICVVFYLLEIIYLYSIINKHKKRRWLAENGEKIHLDYNNIISNTKRVTNRVGSSSMEVFVCSKTTYYGNVFREKIVIPYTSYESFSKILRQEGVDVFINNENKEDYFIQLEKVAEIGWIPNSCRFIPESKIIILVWIAINIIILILGISI